MASGRKTSSNDAEKALLEALIDELSDKQLSSRDLDDVINQHLLGAPPEPEHTSPDQENQEQDKRPLIEDMIARRRPKLIKSPSGRVIKNPDISASSKMRDATRTINPLKLKAKVLALATAELSKIKLTKLLQEIGEILEDKDLGRKLDALTKQHIREQISELFSTASKSIFTSEAEFHDFVREIASEFLAPVDGAELPTEAPALWADRTTGREVTPVDFIKQYYGEFVATDLPQQHRLPRPLLRELDMPLYNAYAAWIKRHPEDDLHLPTRSQLVDLELSNLDEATLRRAGRLKSTAYRRKNDL
jgi:ribosomal protein L12E/L44/L45/RPP1/RPP2